MAAGRFQPAVPAGRVVDRLWERFQRVALKPLPQTIGKKAGPPEGRPGFVDQRTPEARRFCGE